MKPAPQSSESVWQAFDDCATLGQRGSEEGVIVKDDEHRDGARITLERDGRVAPFSITCGIYGEFVHTAFASDEAEGIQKYTDMKERLESILEADSSHRVAQLHDFVADFL